LKKRIRRRTSSALKSAATRKVSQNGATAARSTKPAGLAANCSADLTGPSRRQKGCSIAVHSRAAYSIEKAIKAAYSIVSNTRP
jgi:hypothetical protein